jgi:hypothetical protein
MTFMGDTSLKQGIRAGHLRGADDISSWLLQVAALCQVKPLYQLRKVRRAALDTAQIAAAPSARPQCTASRDLIASRSVSICPLSSTRCSGPKTAPQCESLKESPSQVLGSR